MIDFLCNQTWLEPFYEKIDSKTIPTTINKFKNIRDDLYCLSQKSQDNT